MSTSALAPAIDSATLMLSEDDLGRFPHESFLVKHNLAGDRRFSLPRLVELAQRLSMEQVEYYTGKVAVNQDPKTHPKNGLSVADTVRGIEENGSWMVLKNVQTDPEYAKLLRETLGGVYSRVTDTVHGFHREEAFIFISSPGSVTPYHLDEEHNFLCQVQGTKQVSIWDPRDRTVLPEPQIEHMLQIWHGDDYHRNMPFKQEFQERAREYTLNPGDALHFPVGAPHWVKNGNQVSISFSITFRSRYSERQAIIYFLNGKVRRLGLRPTPPGVSGWRDGLKVAAFQTVRFAARVGGGSWLKRNQSKWA